MKSWSLQKEIKKEILEWYSDGHTVRQIAGWFGVNKSTVENIINPEKYRVARKKHYLKNRRHYLEQMREYQKKRYSESKKYNK